MDVSVGLAVVVLSIWAAWALYLMFAIWRDAYRARRAWEALLAEILGERTEGQS